MAFRLDRYLKELHRIQSVGHRILRANREFCGSKVGPRFGFGATTISNIPRNWRPITRKKLGMNDHLLVTYVADTSPAQMAGIRKGDRLMTIEGNSAPYGRGATYKLNKILANHEMARPLQIEIVRDEKVRKFSLLPDQACQYPVIIDDNSEANAFTDGNLIIIQRGILRLAGTDEELALIIGHELAHATEGHLDKKAQNELAGAFAGLALDTIIASFGLNTKGRFTKFGAKAGFQAYSRDFEKEADYVGMYYASRAGFDTRGVELFWRKMADEYPGSIQYASTHPTSPERFLLIRKIHEEIAAKKTSGATLHPVSRIRRQNSFAGRSPEPP